MIGATARDVHEAKNEINYLNSLTSSISDIFRLTAERRYAWPSAPPVFHPHFKLFMRGIHTCKPFSINTDI
jgi:hypothetical protein